MTCLMRKPILRTCVTNGQLSRHITPCFTLPELLYTPRTYREKSHYALSVALKTLFVEENKLDIRYVRDLLNAMSLREAADYEAEFSESGAKAIITAAETFIATAESILRESHGR